MNDSSEYKIACAPRAADPERCSKGLFQERKEVLTFVLWPQIRILVYAHMQTRFCLAVKDRATKAIAANWGIEETDDMEEQGCARDWKAARGCGCWCY